MVRPWLRATFGAGLRGRFIKDVCNVETGVRTLERPSFLETTMTTLLHGRAPDSVGAFERLTIATPEALTVIHPDGSGDVRHSLLPIRCDVP